MGKREPKEIKSGTYYKIDDISKVEFNKNNLWNILMNITDKDVSSSFMIKLFGEFDGKRLCEPFDMITIPKGMYGANHKKPNKNEFKTTVGLWIFNKYFIEPNNIFNVFGYINKNIDKKLFKKINKKLSFALIEDDISTSELSDFLMKTQKMMPFEIILSPHYSKDLLTVATQINKKKKELINKNKDKLDAGDINTAEDIEKELIKYGENLLKDDDAFDAFRSGAQGTIDGSFKEMYIMRGAIKDPDPTAKKPYSIATSNYMDGISADEYSLFANSLAEGPFSRSNRTQFGGYWEKLFVSAFQHIHIGKKDSDCGTKRTVTVKLTEDNAESWMYNYIVQGSKTVELTSKNVDSFIGKTVKFRFSSLCESKDCICNKCAGNLWYRIGLENLGLLTGVEPTTLKLKAMKAFHDASVNTKEMNPMKAFGLEE